MTVLKYPAWICHDCGVKYCNGATTGHRATYHLDDCQCCGAKNVPCSEPRDYNHFKQWPIEPKNESSLLSAENNEPTLQDLVNPVLEGFDFDKVQRVMQVVDWKWAFTRSNGSLSVPSVDDLKDRARVLLESAIRQYQYNDEYPYIVATGGLYAKAWEDAIELNFILEQSSLELQDLDE